MKCANPDCNRSIGLVHYQRGWFKKRRYCSRLCRDSFVAHPSKRPPQERTATTYLGWLVLQPLEKSQPKPIPAVIRRAKR
jgi:hypothetical protein